MNSFTSLRRYAWWRIFEEKYFVNEDKIQRECGRERESEKNVLYLLSMIRYINSFCRIAVYTRSLCEWWGLGCLCFFVLALSRCHFLCCPGCAVIENAFNSIDVTGRERKKDCVCVFFGCICSVPGCMWNLCHAMDCHNDRKTLVAIALSQNSNATHYVFLNVVTIQTQYHKTQVLPCANNSKTSQLRI